MLTDKPALRARLRADRDAFARNRTSFASPPPFLDRMREGTMIASYAPLGGEVDPALFEQAALARRCDLALPHVVDRATPLRFLLHAPDAKLVSGPFGLRQPAADAPEITPDIILTPLVGFDRRGNRLGQGAGHYDRAFAQFPHAWRVGLAWSVQEVDALPCDPWDVPLHAIATEKEWITP
jgi:5-formyltetrahydrofolate cyclo-ligase